MILASVLLLGVNFNKPMSQAQIEAKARSYGMEYPSNLKVIGK